MHSLHRRLQHAVGHRSPYGNRFPRIVEKRHGTIHGLYMVAKGNKQLFAHAHNCLAYKLKGFQVIDVPYEVDGTVVRSGPAGVSIGLFAIFTGQQRRSRLHKPVCKSNGTGKRNAVAQFHVDPFIPAGRRNRLIQRSNQPAHLLRIANFSRGHVAQHIHMVGHHLANQLVDKLALNGFRFALEISQALLGQQLQIGPHKP